MLYDDLRICDHSLATMGSFCRHHYRGLEAGGHKKARFEFSAILKVQRSLSIKHITRLE